MRRSYVFNWEYVINGGDFQFVDIPYGDYLLVGVKTGIPSFTSVVIHLTPGQPVIQNVEMSCGTGKYGFKVTTPVQPETDPVVVYPNPCHDILTISGLSGVENVSLRLINMQGIPTKQPAWTFKNDYIEMHLNSCSPGIYFVEIYSDRSLIAHKKIIVL
jgi:hypothetical protein